MNATTVIQDSGERYVDLKELQARYRVSASTIYEWLKAGNFPPPRKFGRTTRWSLKALEEWEKEQPQGVRIEDKFHWQRRLQKQ